MDLARTRRAGLTPPSRFPRCIDAYAKEQAAVVDLAVTSPPVHLALHVPPPVDVVQAAVRTTKLCVRVNEVSIHDIETTSRWRPRGGWERTKS